MFLAVYWLSPVEFGSNQPVTVASPGTRQYRVSVFYTSGNGGRRSLNTISPGKQLQTERNGFFCRIAGEFYLVMKVKIGQVDVSDNQTPCNCFILQHLHNI
jgi:hypothetical protein